MTRLLLSALIAITVAGCTDITNITCNQIASKAARSSKGELIEIYGQRLNKRTDTKVICHGKGKFRDGKIIGTRSQAQLDGNGNITVSYDTRQAVAREKADRELRRLEIESRMLGY